MNKKQLVYLWVGILAMIGMALYPPFKVTYLSGNRLTIYGFLYCSFGMTEKMPVNIDLTLLCIQWLMVILIIGGLILTVKTKK